MPDDDENERVLAALQRLQVSLTKLPDKQDPPHLSHWRMLPESIQGAYQYISQGAELVKATSTKYTLVGKIDSHEGSKLAKELLRGCELIATGVLVIHSNEQGCARSTRHFGKQASRAVLATTVDLVTVFAQHHEHDTKNLAAQKTGAVWNTSDSLLKVPQGNRNSIRRELFTYVMECNETLQEFTELIEEGASSNGLETIGEEESNAVGTSNNNDMGEATWDDFCDGNDQQYSASELPVATASLCLVKCSRGSINVCLKACESVGNVVESSGENKSDARVPLLDWIKTLEHLARRVGEGMTDLGTCLYPPLNLTEGDEDCLQAQLLKQRDALVALNEFVLDCPTELTEEVMELASKLKGAAASRCDEATAAISTALEND